MKKKAIKAQVKVVKCHHYWLYPPSAIIEGREENEVAVVRYCVNCKQGQIAFASKWRKVPKGYDIEDLIT
jgi:Pyruvate/2-oxoacid:ferredoxin oxidoreductase delta subunit